MVKASIILIPLLLILHVHLTATLPAHALEGRDLTMLPSNISRHKLEKRNDSSSDLIDFLKKGVLIMRPRNLPEFVSASGSVNDCEKAKDLVAFSTCCVLFNRNIVIDTPRPGRLTFRSRLRLWWHDFFRRLTTSRFVPDEYGEKPPMDPNDPIYRTVEFTNQDTRPRGPFISDGAGGYIFMAPLKVNPKYRRIPYCPKLDTVPEEEEEDLCLLTSVDNIIHQDDLSKKKNKKQKTQLTINPLEMANHNAAFAYVEEIDDKTLRVVLDTYRRLANQFLNLEDFFRNLKEWAEAFGLSVKEAAKQFHNHRQVGESSRSRFMCDDEDNNSDDTHDELRK